MPSVDADTDPALLLRRPKTSANPWQPCRKCGMSYVQIPREHCGDCERTARQQPKVPEILVNGKKPSQDLTVAPAPAPRSQHRPRLRKRVAPDGGGLHPGHASKASRSRIGPAPRRAPSPDVGKEQPEGHRSVYELSTDGAQHEEETTAAPPATEPEAQIEADHETGSRHGHEPQHEDEQDTGHTQHDHGEVRSNSTLQPTSMRNRAPNLSPAAKQWRAKVRPLLGAAAGPSPMQSPMPSPPPSPHLPGSATTDEAAGPVSPPLGSGSPKRFGGGGSFAQRVLNEVGVPSLERQRVLEQELRRARADNRRLRDLVRGMTVRAEALDRFLDLDGGNDARAALFDDDDDDDSPLLHRVYPDLCRRCRGVVQGHALRQSGGAAEANRLGDGRER